MQSTALKPIFAAGLYASTGMSIACRSIRTRRCEQKCECKGGCDKDEYNLCVADSNEAERRSIVARCTREFDNLVAREDITGYCDTSTYKADCEQQERRWKARVNLE